MPRVYIIEGLDGVGKSTAAKGLAERLNALYITSPTIELSDLKEVFDDETNGIERFFFYLIGNYKLSRKIMNNAFKEDIVIDRFIASTLAYHNSLLNQDLSKFVRWQHIIAPNQGFYLYADQEIRIARMNKRGEKTRTDKHLEQNIQLAITVGREYERFLSDYHRIDTSKSDKEEVIETMYKKIKGE